MYILKKLTASLVIYNPNIDRVLETINSLFTDYPEVFLTIIDNSPVKNSIEGRLPKDYKINYHWHGKNIGFGAGHNLAVKLSAESEYHLLVNPDIMVKKGCIHQLINFLDTNLEVGLVGPKILNPNGSVQYSCKRNPTMVVLFIRWAFPRRFIERYQFLKKYNDYYEMQDFDYSKNFSMEFLSGCFMLIRSSLFKKLGGFDDKFFLYLEDADLTRRVNQVSKSVYVPKAEVIHDWGRGSHKNFKLAFIMIQSMVKYFMKWGFCFCFYQKSRRSKIVA